MKYTCPCCGYKSLSEKASGTDEICKICFWQDDGVQLNNPFFEGGANKVSLYEGQQNFISFGACEIEMKHHVRVPTSEDEFDEKWRPIELRG